MRQEDLLATYQNNYFHLRNIALHYLGVHSPDIDDVLQSAFLKAWCSTETLRNDSCVYSWLSRIVGNESISYLRKRARAKEYLFDDCSFLDNWSICNEQPMTSIYIEQLVESLRSPYQEPFWLYYVIGCQVKEIAIRLSRPESTIRGQLRIARKIVQSVA